MGDMNLSIAELMVLIDTLSGSLSLYDRLVDPLFKYSAEMRRTLLNRLEHWTNQNTTAPQHGLRAGGDAESPRDVMTIPGGTQVAAGIPMCNVVFYGNNTKEVGRLTWDTGRFVFSGDAEESAKVFFEFLANLSGRQNG